MVSAKQYSKLSQEFFIVVGNVAFCRKFQKTDFNKIDITVISISRNGLLKSCARFVIE